MIRTILILLPMVLVLSIPSPVAAQEAAGTRDGTAAVLGVVVDGDTDQPLAGVGIEAWRLVDSTRVAGTASDGAGHFRIAGLTEGEYYLRLSSLGYATVPTEPFELAYGETRDLGILSLPTEALELEPIRVSAERTVVTFDGDRTSYNVGLMPGTEGEGVTEALRAVPELQVDIDGRITLRGETPVIHIDGRPTAMSGEDLALFLEQFPADYLARVEVIENPSARYGAEGSGGIVNLVLKEGVELGLSGSVHARAGTRGQYGTGGRGTLQRGPWTLNGYGNVGLTDVERSEFDLRQNLLTDPAFLRQESSSDRSGLSGNLGLDTRYDLTERSRVSARARLSQSDSDTDRLTTTTHLDQGEDPFLRYDQASAARSRGFDLDLSAGFDHRWEPRRHELEIDLSYERGRDLRDSREELSLEELLDDLLIPAELTLDNESERGQETSIEVDYTRPWGEEGRVEAGFDFEVEDTDHDRIIHFVEDGSGNESTLTDRGYSYRQRVGAAYVTVGRDLGGVGVQVGLRAERTSAELGLPGGEDFRNDYLNLFPSATVSYRLDQTRRLRLSYSRRVRRPSATVLNPVDRSTDPLTRRVGNPAIEPQFTHSASLDANQSSGAGNFRVSAYYRHTTNGWAETMSVDDRGVSTRTYQNLTSERAYGASFTYSLRPVEGWNGFVNVSGRRQLRDASNLSDRYSGSALLWSGRARVNARVTDALSAQASFSYSPPRDVPQGRFDASYAADLGLRYRFLGERASLRLALRDPFGLRRSGVHTQDLDYIQIGRSEESTRSAVLTLSYTFGGQGQRRGRGR